MKVVSENMFLETVIPQTVPRRRSCSFPADWKFVDEANFWVSDDEMVAHAICAVKSWLPQVCSERHLPGWCVSVQVPLHQSLLPCPLFNVGGNLHQMLAHCRAKLQSENGLVVHDSKEISNVMARRHLAQEAISNKIR